VTNENKKDKNEPIFYYCSEFNCKFFASQLQAKFKHAIQFGITGNYTPKNGELFKQALIKHMDKAERISGTFHGTPVDDNGDKDDDEPRDGSLGGGKK